ncbi:MAG: GLUG motif-containing protein, partial [Bacteroidales bacterium]
AQTSTPPSAGVGTKENPYQIATLDNLYWLSQTTAKWVLNIYFIQTADIDATSTASWDGAKGFKPIGRLASTLRFASNYDGNGKSISNLFINRPLEDGVGLFGYVSEKISNLTLTNANITGHNFVGALVGLQNSGNVKRCSSSGIVSGTSYVGGLIGFSVADIEQSFSSANVSVTSNNVSVVPNLGGGLCGSFDGDSRYVKNCYATGSVTGGASAQKLGGLIGGATGTVGTTTPNTIQDCYSTGAVSATAGTDLGGLIGSLTDATVTGCYWDTETSTMANSAAGTAKTTVQMQTMATFIDWDFELIWAINGDNYPSFDFRLPTFGGGAGTVANPFLISSYNHLTQLSTLPEFWGASFSQTSNIDASASATTPYNSIGLDPAFTGTYNGNDYSIDGLTTAFADGAGGLFANIKTATISNINLTNANISSLYMVGGIVGYAEASTISNCSVTGSINAVTIAGGVVGAASNTNINKCSSNVVVGGNIMYGEENMTHFGGLVGLVNDAGTTISNSYAKGTVSAYNVVGGLVGGVDIASTALGGGATPSNTMGFTMTNCYAANTLTVSASGATAGGVFGQSNYVNTNNAITITNSFWDTEVSVNSTSYIGGTGKTTAEMKTQSTFTGWDFTTPIWSIKSTYNNGYPNLNGQVESVSLTWDGSTNTNWNTAANWTPEGVPAAADDVVIPNTVTNFPTLTAAGTCKNITIQSGASLLGNENLTVTGTATVERSIAAWGTGASAAHGWHFLSSPVAAQAIDPAFTNPTAANYDFYSYWEPTNSWVNYKNTTTAPTWNDANASILNFVPGKGYLVEYAAAATKQFTGTLNKLDVSLNNLDYGSGSYKGFHLLGNPFVSAIKWNDGNWGTMTNVVATAKIWNDAIATYTDIAANGIIPALNGFMVEVTNATNSLTIPVAARVHSATAWYKSSNNPSIVLLATDPGSQTAQESTINFNSQATEGFDASFDSHFLAGYAPQFYSVANGESLSTNTLPTPGETVNVPLTFVKNEGTTFSITAKSIANIQGAVILTDLKTNMSQDLSINPEYSFTSATGDEPKRFVLTLGPLSVDDNAKQQALLVYASGSTVYISSTEGIGLKGDLFVYNTIGQTLLQQKLTGKTLTEINLNASTGYYLVKVVTEDNAYTSKVFIRR